MRLVTFEVQTPIGPFERVGMLDTNAQIVDASFVVAEYLRRTSRFDDPYREAAHLAPGEMMAFITGRERSVVQPELASHGARGERLVYALDEIRLKAPLPRPRRIHDFMVVEEHVRNYFHNVPDAWYEIPACYKGNPDAVVGPDEPIYWPRYTRQLDYELELCAVVGRTGKDVQVDDAGDYIYGYSIFNDYSARDVQTRESTIGLGPFKGKDFANAIGPCIATADEFDATRARMVLRVNGEVWSEGTIGRMRFSFTEIIAYLSNEEWIYPGDVLGSGTVGRGCGAEIDRWIKPGDVVEAEVEGIGVLANPIRLHDEVERATFAG
jgi:2-keto-4-pentenoate hydratase/2-oxohepta-3-ene-1,7-dioic acid hydratase in catechol pathway